MILRLNTMINNITDKAILPQNYPVSLKTDPYSPVDVYWLILLNNDIIK